MKKFFIILFATFTSMLLFGDLQDYIKHNLAAYVSTGAPTRAGWWNTRQYTQALSIHAYLVKLLRALSALIKGGNWIILEVE